MSFTTRDNQSQADSQLGPARSAFQMTAGGSKCKGRHRRNIQGGKSTIIRSEDDHVHIKEIARCLAYRFETVETFEKIETLEIEETVDTVEIETVRK